MLIYRDISSLLENELGTYIQIVIGPRQCGKSTLLAALGEGKHNEVTFDDLQLRNLANEDPALFLSQYETPLIIDEVQYAPNIFPELKQRVDKIKQDKLLKASNEPVKPLFRLTGSNQILLDKFVKETLVGRASYFSLNTLTVHEILQAQPDTTIQTILFQGGWPELYVNSSLKTTAYLNDYIRLYIEKDIILSAGISKQREFHTILGMLAARTGGFVNYSDISKDSGIRSVTVREWVSILERSDIVSLLLPCEANLNKRLIKTPKLYFLDTGLAARLQGWSEIGPLMVSPQIGSLFETLVYAEIIKFIQNFAAPWRISVWRTKDGEEVDFIIDTGTGHIIALDAKLGIHNVKPQNIPANFAKTFPQVKELLLVSLGGQLKKLSDTCRQIPLAELTDYLLNILRSAN